MGGACAVITVLSGDCPGSGSTVLGAGVGLVGGWATMGFGGKRGGGVNVGTLRTDAGDW